MNVSKGLISICLLLVGCGSTRSELRPAVSASESCDTGELVFAQSYLPTDVLVTPDGKSLLVVDHGFLALRDPATLAVQRFLLPRVDGWSTARFSSDGTTLLAETFDGQHYEFSTSSWEAKRLPNEVATLQREQHEMSLAMDLLAPGRSQARLALFAIHEAHARFPFDPNLVQLSPRAAAFDPVRRELLISGEDGTLLLLDLAGNRVLQRVQCRSCEPYAFLGVDEDGFFGATATGKLRLLDRSLRTLREEAFLPPAPDKSADAWSPELIAFLETTRHGLDTHAILPREDTANVEGKPRSVRRLVRIQGTSRIAWLTHDFELGVYDLASRAHGARIVGSGLSGVDGGALLDEHRIALVTAGELQVWDIANQRLSMERRGGYTALARIDPARLLVAGRDGFAELIAADTGAVEKRFCITRQACEEKPLSMAALRVELNQVMELSEEAQAQALTAIEARLTPRIIELMVSPDRKRLVAVHSPSKRRSRSAPALPGAITVWSLPGLEPLGSRNLDWEDLEGRLRFGADGALSDGSKLIEISGLPSGTPKQANEDEPSREREYGSADFRVVVVPWSQERYESHYDQIALVRENRNLGLLAFDRDASQENVKGRGLLRRGTVADVSPAGDRFLLTSPGGEVQTPLYAVSLPTGPSQVWCAPRGELASTPPHPELPEVSELDGITEVALAQPPRHYLALAASDEGTAYLLASDRPARSTEKSGLSLWSIEPGATKAQQVPLPELDAKWVRLEIAPDDGTVWLLGDRALAHLGTNGEWTVHPIDDPSWEERSGYSVYTVDFLALHGGRAVFVHGYRDGRGGPLELIVAGPGHERLSRDIPGAGPPGGLVPLPDGFVLNGSQQRPRLRFKDGQWLERDPLLDHFERFRPQYFRLLNDRLVLLDGETWREVNPATGEILKEVPRAEYVREHRYLVGTPGTEIERPFGYDDLPLRIGRSGKVLAFGAVRAPKWVGGEGIDISSASDTSRGTWMLLSDVALFWDGTRFTAYFHPSTRSSAFAALVGSKTRRSSPEADFLLAPSA